jgi:predicted phosphodiesterase
VTVRKVAAIYDVHGNLPALEAVLAEVEREQPDVVVFGGDLAAGWYPAETLARIRQVPRARFVSGNCDRVMVELFDGKREADHELTDFAARRIERGDRDFLAGFEPVVEIEVEGLGPVLFCHATPTSDSDVLTPLTPDAETAAALAGAPPVVVYGHIHVQGDRRVGGHRLVNAGAVGLPYGHSAAGWALLGPDVELRRTAYDFDTAVPQLAAAPGWPGAAQWAERLRRPPSEEDALREFEAMRGKAPA